jgi:molybdate transport system ATP-binding protein
MLDRVTVARPGGTVVLRDLSWTIRDGETWAVVGPTGSGKTTLAETLLGRHHLQSGSLTWPLLDRLRAAGRQVAFASEVVRLVAFKEDSRLFSYAGHYYQQRFEFADADEPLTLDQYLRSGTGASDEQVRDAARRLGIDDRLSLSFMKLSNGQTRRARIARALLSHPELLILDDPFQGVDAAGRVEVADLLGGLVKDGLRLVLICPPDAVPKWATHKLELGEPRRAGGVSPLLNLQIEENRGLTPPARQDQDAPPVVELRHVSVAHGGRTILHDVTWTVRAGERWAVVGPNGSGKTTLLSLLCGDHPQAYSNDVRLFGRRRGTGESVWDVKRRVGLVSPEFHLYFTEPLTAERTAATGFFDAVTDRPTTEVQDDAVRRLFDEFGIAHLARRPFRQLSTGEQRLVLLVRALVKRPPLLILDEPFQGLDAAAVGRARDWLDRNLGVEQTLLFVSHHADEIPRTVTRRLELNGGRAAVVNP